MLQQNCENWPHWPSKRTALIAEVGINHGGDESLAWEMILSAHENGADFIKLQTYATERFFHSSLPYFDSTKSMELSPEATSRLFEKAKALGAKLMTTPFDFASVDLIESFSPPTYKVASMDNDNFPLIQYIAERGRPMIISCGMISVDEIARVIEVVEKTDNDKLILLHCISDYPTDPGSLNLSMIPYLSKKFKVPIGFSDHSIGMDSAYLAASLGAAVIEKHFTTDRNLAEKYPDADHEISFEPEELKNLKRFCEKVPLMQGVAPREITCGENEGRISFRRGLYTKVPIEAGEKLSLENTVLLRPVKGIPANQWYDVNGKIFNRKMKPNESINFSDLDMD